ncbi:4555_t:CDS:1, partial [Racocetra persica]
FKISKIQKRFLSKPKQKHPVKLAKKDNKYKELFYANDKIKSDVAELIRRPQNISKRK